MRGRPAPVLADEFYFVAHDSTTGRRRLRPRVSGLGMAGALLGELVLDGYVRVEGGVIGLAAATRPPGDALARATWNQLRAEPAHREIGTWLAYFARTAEESVAHRLTRAALLAPQSGRWRRSAVTYVPTNTSKAAWPELRLRMQVAQQQVWTYQDMTLAGLITAAGLGDRILWDLDTRAREVFQHRVASLPGSLGELVAHTEAAIAELVLGPRG